MKYQKNIIPEKKKNINIVRWLIRDNETVADDIKYKQELSYYILKLERRFKKAVQKTNKEFQPQNAKVNDINKEFELTKSGRK